MIVFYHWINYGICQKGKFVFVILCRHQWNWQWHIFWLMEKKYASRGTKQVASKNVLTKYKIVMQPQHAQYMKWGSEWVSLIMNALGNNRCPHTWQLNHGTLFWRTLNYIIDNIQKNQNPLMASHLPDPETIFLTIHIVQMKKKTPNKILKKYSTSTRKL